MATTWKAPTWRMPNEKNQSKFENYGLTFDGSNETISLNTSTISFADSFSISMWINPSSLSGFQMLFGGSGYSGGNGIGHYIHDDTVRTYVSVGGTATEIFQSSALLNTSTWTHIIIQREKGTRWEMWVDGVLQQTNTTARLTDDLTSANSTIAKHYNSALYNFNGSISDATIFDYALSSTQISSLYNSGSPINPMTLKPAPIAYYPLGGNASTGGDATNTLSVPNIAVPDASVFEFTPPDYINLGNPEELQITGAITLSLWFNSTTATGGFITKSDGGGYFGNNAQKVFEVGLLSNTLYWIISDGTSSNTLSHSFSSYLDGNWHHLMVTWDGTTNAASMKLFIDGSEVADNQATISAIQNKSNDVVISSKGVAYDYTGKISNVAIWNSDQSSEISNIYNSGVPATTYTNTPTAWYKLDQSANWEADTASNWQTPDAVSSYPQSFDFGEANAGGEYIDAPTNIGGFTKCSTSVWLNPSSVSARSTIFATNTANNFTAYFWTGNIIYVTVDGAYGYLAAISNYIDANKWNHLSIVYDGTFNDSDAATQNAGRLKMYVNGSYIAFQAISGTIPSSIPVLGSDNIRIGTTSPTTYEFGGELSNFTIYDTNLSASQVETLYNNGVPLTTAIASDNLKAWYKLDNTETFTQNASGNEEWAVFNNTASPAITGTAISELNGSANPGPYGGFNYFGWRAANYSDPTNYHSLPTTHLGFSCWYKYQGPTTPAGNATRHIFAATSASYYMTFYLYDNGAFRIYGDASNKYVSSSSSELTNGKWHNICIYMPNSTTNNASDIKLWIDGVERNLTPSGGFTTYPQKTLWLGAYNYSSGGTPPRSDSFYDYVIYDTDISNDVSTIYNNGVPTDVSSLNPYAYYKFDSTNITFVSNRFELTDLSGNNRNAFGPYRSSNDRPRLKSNSIRGGSSRSSGMTEQNLVNNNVSALNGESSGMDTSNLVTSTLTRQVPYNSYSLNFDSASSDYIDTGASSFSGLTEMSVSAWVKPTATGTGAAEAILSTEAASPNRGFYLSLFVGSKFRWQVSTDGSNKDSLDNGTIVLNEWTHIVATWNQSTMNLYQNGSLVGTMSTVNATGTFSTTNNMFIGQRVSGAGYFPGNISNVSIFNEELTSTEVMKLYNSGVPGDLSSFNPNPTAWWSLGSDSYFNGSNWICPDLVGSNNGTSANMDDDALIGDAPNSTANGTSTNMAIDANLTGDAPNSSNNSFSVNMDYIDRETSVPS